MQGSEAGEERLYYEKYEVGVLLNTKIQLAT